MIDLALILLPWPLFVIPFRLASDNVIPSMAFVSTILGLTAITFSRALLGLLTFNFRVLVVGLISTVALYFIFLFGHMLASFIELGGRLTMYIL